MMKRIFAAAMTLWVILAPTLVMAQPMVQAKNLCWNGTAWVACTTNSTGQAEVLNKEPQNWRIESLLVNGTINDQYTSGIIDTRAMNGPKWLALRYSGVVAPVGGWVSCDCVPFGIADTTNVFKFYMGGSAPRGWGASSYQQWKAIPPGASQIDSMGTWYTSRMIPLADSVAGSAKTMWFDCPYMRITVWTDSVATSGKKWNDVYMHLLGRPE